MKFTVPDRIISVHAFDSEALRQNPKIDANIISFIPSKIKWDLIPNPLPFNVICLARTILVIPTIAINIFVSIIISLR